MNVHLITSRQSLQEDIAILREMIRIVQSLGHKVVDEWFEEAYDLLVRDKLAREDWADVFKKRKEAIAKADAIIVESTYENFAVGYQVAAAVQQKKPVLLLRKKSADKNAFVTGLIDEWVKHDVYGDDTIERSIANFLNDNDIQTKDMRFNFFIDRPIYNYLRWTSMKTGKTKAEILRDLVEREIDRSNS